MDCLLGVLFSLFSKCWRLTWSMVGWSRDWTSEQCGWSLQHWSWSARWLNVGLKLFFIVSCVESIQLWKKPTLFFAVVWTQISGQLSVYLFQCITFKVSWQLRFIKKIPAKPGSKQIFSFSIFYTWLYVVLVRILSVRIIGIVAASIRQKKISLHYVISY